MTQGRFPSHLLLSHSVQCSEAECVAGCPIAALDEQSGNLRANGGGIRTVQTTQNLYNDHGRKDPGSIQMSYRDQGGASKFYKTFRPSSENPRGDLMRYLLRLITPPGGIVLDPFGSHDTAQACQDEGFNYIGIEEAEVKK